MNDCLTILQGDALKKMRELPSESVQCCVTSPPYWGLRDYGTEGQIGLEKTPEDYVANIVAVFAEVRRVLKADGTAWLNLGDSYYNYRPGGDGLNRAGIQKNTLSLPQSTYRRANKYEGLKEKDLVGVPWLAAFALRSDGWYLRSEITWCKKVPMPESVRDRPTCATEKIFLLSKSQQYFYDAEAVRNPLRPRRAGQRTCSVCHAAYMRRWRLGRVMVPRELVPRGTLLSASQRKAGSRLVRRSQTATTEKEEARV